LRKEATFTNLNPKHNKKMPEGEDIAIEHD
jgi:hypothetical protein